MVYVMLLMTAPLLLPLGSREGQMTRVLVGWELH